MTRQLLHPVLGGELVDVRSTEFEDLSKVDVEAEKAWRAKAQQTVDDADTRYFVVHLHRLLDPSTDVAEG